jgi:hypothetical protein
VRACTEPRMKLQGGGGGPSWSIDPGEQRSFVYAATESCSPHDAARAHKPTITLLRFLPAVSAACPPPRRAPRPPDGRRNPLDSSLFVWETITHDSRALPKLPQEAYAGSLRSWKRGCSLRGRPERRRAAACDRRHGCGRKPFVVVAVSSHPRLIRRATGRMPWQMCRDLLALRRCAVFQGSIRQRN